MLREMLFVATVCSLLLRPSWSTEPASTSTTHVTTPVRWFGFWDPDSSSEMRGFTNLAFCDAWPLSTATAEAHANVAQGIQCLFYLESLFLTQLPNRSYALRHNHSAIWAELRQPLCDLIVDQKALGFFLGDELVYGGLPWGELDTYATMVKDGCPSAKVYYNEAFPPIFGMGRMHTLNASPYFYPHVPTSLDWVSMDLYPDWFSVGGAIEFVRWSLFGKMADHQRAVLVPPAYGDRPNASITAMDCDGLDCDETMSVWASEMAAFATSDYAQGKVIGILPFKWRYPNSSCHDRHDRRCVGAADLPKTRQLWQGIGRSIVNQSLPPT